MAKYNGLTSLQWANRIVEYNPGKFDKSSLVKLYAAQQLCQPLNGPHELGHMRRLLHAHLVILHLPH